MTHTKNSHLYKCLITNFVFIISKVLYNGLFTCRLEQVGRWTWNAADGPQAYLKRPLYHDLHQVYNGNFQGRELTVAMVDHFPFFKVLKGPGGSVHPISGSDFKVLKAVADGLNFT